MKSVYKYYIFSVFPIILFSCNQKKTITIKNKIFDNQFEIYEVLKSDKKTKEGPYYRINALGDTIEKVNYMEGKMEGQRILYYPNGQVEIVENYINNQYNGPYQSFYENGSPKQFGTFKDGQFESELKTYYQEPAGQLKESVWMSKGVENGPIKIYFTNGQLKESYSYKDGIKEGGFKEYHPNGILAAEGQYVDDFEDGEVKVFDTLGNHTKTYIFKDKKPIETLNIKN
ncbi:MAG: toxin-antitoxin system YwqK family antitoxin [Chitinophagales bacterium]|nr:toxin-antitoxin system YwqK family antitoxin [Chitinophagales bacterium]MCZ2393167.1 toxin-antitoxin system YwqK family antitoxin [Chitinophagales bacterium]